jgi:probable phosphoglycerate mutase
MTQRPARLGWIRHGITEWNRLGKIQGVTDIPLSPEGIRQAELLAGRLVREGEHWNGIVCSDLQRACRTAEIIGERLGIPVRRDVRLRERFFGAAEGTTHAERLTRWGEEWRRLVPDQESDDAVTARGLEFVQEMIDRHTGEAWLVVTHGSFLARMLHSLCRDLEDSHLQNVSLTVMEKKQDGWSSLLHNCTAHLSGDSVEVNK